MSNQSESSPGAETTIAVLLGAAEFPRYPGLEPSPAFAAGASAFGRYLKDRPVGLGLGDARVLDLFDSPLHAGEQIERIHDFLSERTSARDLIVYYCGYAALAGSACHLVIRRAKAEILAATGLSTDALGSVIRAWSAGRRTHVVLDCCFIGEALRSLQLPIIDGLAARARAILPAEGCSLLAAASRAEPGAGAPQPRFSTCLLDVLKRGAVGLPPTMSLREVSLEVERVLGERFPPGARPELHVPQQSIGDASMLPLFPNAAAPRWPEGFAPRGAETLNDRMPTRQWAPLRRGMTASGPATIPDAAPPPEPPAAIVSTSVRTFEWKRAPEAPLAPSLLPPAPRPTRHGYKLGVALGLFFIGLAVLPVFFVSSEERGDLGSPPASPAAVPPSAAAGADRPIVDPAPPGDDAARHIEAARRAIEAERWGEALTAATAARALEPNSRTAEALIEQAQVEVSNESVYLQFKRAVVAQDYANVAALYRRLDPESVYRVKAQDDHDRSKADFIRLRAQQGEALADDGRCRDQDQLAVEAGHVWSEAGRVVLGYPCDPSDADGSEAQEEEDGDVATAADHRPAASRFDELLEQSRDAAAEGQYARSLRFCELAAEERPRDQIAAVTCGVAACRLKDGAKARKFIRRTTSATRQQQVQQICLQEGVTEI